MAAGLLVGLAPGASADLSRLDVTAVAPPAWTAGQPGWVHYVVRNEWSEDGGPLRQETVHEPAPLGAESGKVPLPAVPRGTVRYRLTADQYCGFFERGARYEGASAWRTQRVV